MECSWNKPKSVPEVKSVEELYPTNNTYSPLTREITDEDRASFYEELKEYGQSTGLMWILSLEPKIRSLSVKTVDEIILSEEFIRHQMKKEYLLQKLQISSDDRQIIHDFTIGQRDNPSWLLLRKGRLTASNFGHILNSWPANLEKAGIHQKLYPQRVGIRVWLDANLTLDLKGHFCCHKGQISEK